MSPARWPRDNTLDERLMHVDPARGTTRDAAVRELPGMLRPGDALIVNDAATMPASLQGTAQGEPVELRLAASHEDGSFTALLFGRGDWRTKTEDRPKPPALEVGDVVRFGDELSARVEAHRFGTERFVDVRFDRSGGPFWEALYRHGRPIQYAYVAGPLELWHAQTRFGARPWCAELPSAGRPLAWETLIALTQRGIEIGRVTHAAGLSSTGEPELDRLLPLPERYDIPAETVTLVERTKARGGRVVAVGTTVARALEGSAAAHGGELVAGAGVTDLVLGESTRLRVADGILTGIHDPSESHFRLLSAFAPPALLESALEHASRAGYLCHEFGDSSLILAAA